MARELAQAERLLGTMIVILVIGIMQGILGALLFWAVGLPSPVFLGVLWWRLAGAPALPGQDALSLRIAQHAGAGILRDVSPHLLVMTATPIPRTVAMTVFGDLETSSLTEVPAGRAGITTVAVPAGNTRWTDRTWAPAASTGRAGRIRAGSLNRYYGAIGATRRTADLFLTHVMLWRADGCGRSSCATRGSRHSSLKTRPTPHSACGRASSDAVLQLRRFPHVGPDDDRRRRYRLRLDRADHA